MKPYRLFLVSGLLLLASFPAHAIVDVNDNGLSDLWEKAHNDGNLFPSNFDPQADPDSDGWTNAQEAAAGTDPSDANPPAGYLQPEITYYPAVYSSDPEMTQSPAMVTLNWPTLPGKQYTLHYSTELAPGNWSPLDEPRIGTGWDMGSGITLTQPDGSIAERIFWRVAVTDPVPAIDTDSDGLGDYEEYLAGTDPVITDSDGDTLSDYAELIAGTNPNHADEDGDGITDPLEIAAGTDSKNQDTDGDAIPDWLDTQPLLSAQVFADADDDGIPDANDPDPNNPRGPKPLIISENASGNPNFELEKNESSSFILTVSNPAGPAPTSSDFTLYLNGNEETANITALTTPPSATGTQRFDFSWLAKVTTSYPAQTLQNISLRFRDSQNATTWLNVARADVAEWEGYIATAPIRQAGTDENGMSLRVQSHVNGKRHADWFGSPWNAKEVYYRGPRSIAVLNEATNAMLATFQIPAGVKSPLFITRYTPTGISNTATIDAGDFASYPHNSDWYYNHTPWNVSYNWGGIITDVAGTSMARRNYGTAWEYAPIVLKWWPQGQMNVLVDSSWLHAHPFTDTFQRIVHSVYSPENSSFARALGFPLYSKLPASITPHLAGTLENPGLAIHPLAIEKKSALFLVNSETYYQILYKVDPAAGEWTAGIKLHLGRTGGDDTTPQAGIGLYQSTSGVPTPVSLDAAGDILLSPTENSILYQKITSNEGLPLFLKRTPSVDQPHTLEIQLLSKYESGKVTTVAAVDLPLIDIVDKSGVMLTELKVGKMYPDVLTGNGLNGDPVNVNLDKDDDRFFVRVKIPDSFGTIKMKFETVDNAEAMYNDDPTEYTLEAKDGYLTTKSMILVSDDVDDNHLLSTGGDLDNSSDDRTHLVQLGGSFKISAIKAGMGNWIPIDIKLPVKKKKTVRVQFVNCTYGFFAHVPCWDPSWIAWVQRKMRQRYAQVGVDFDFPTVLAGPWVSNTGSMADSEIFSLPSGTGKIVFPQESKNLVDHGPPNDFNNTLMIYLVRGLDSYRGAATPPKYVNAVDVRFQNKVFLAQFDFKDFTAAHEALHVLSDAAHDVAPYLDFDTEYANMHTIWTQPSEAQAERRNNGSIGSTKRISLAQEVKIQSATLAK